MSEVFGVTPSGDVPAFVAGTGPTTTMVPFELNRGCRLASGTTYYFPLTGGDTRTKHITLTWDSSAIVAFSIECTSIPPTIGNMGGAADLTNWNSSAGNGWVRENPPSATISVTSTDGTTGGATVTNSVITVAGGTAGGASVHFPNMGSKRMRLKAVVSGTGGLVRCVEFGKS